MIWPYPGEIVSALLTCPFLNDAPVTTVYVARRDFMILKYGRHGARFRKTKRTTWGRAR
jgi:hypothetical protein